MLPTCPHFEACGSGKVSQERSPEWRNLPCPTTLVGTLLLWERRRAGLVALPDRRPSTSFPLWGVLVALKIVTGCGCSPLLG